MSTLWRRLFSAALLATLICTGACSEAAPDKVSGVVEWIYDGDTLKVAGVGKVRLIGIDTPEKDDSSRDRSFTRLGVKPQQLRASGQAALRFNIAQVKGKTVRLRFDGPQKDRHNRTLAYVYLPDGRMLNRLLLEQGYAVVYRRFDFQHKDDFLRAEDAARGARIGLWED